MLKRNKDEKEISKVTYIEILYVDILATTPYSINCDLFERYFDKTIKKKVLAETNVIDSLLYFIEDTKLENNPITNINTRFKIILINEDSEKNDTICGSKFGIQTAGSKYMISKEFQNYLRVIMEK